MKQYKRIMLGANSKYAEQCYKEGFIGADYCIEQNLTHHLSENWRDFNKKFIPIWLEQHPDKSKIAAGLSCGMLWTICKGIKKGDIVLCPDGMGKYYVGEIVGDYYYKFSGILPHRREVVWSDQTILRSEMSQELKNSAGSIGTTSDITKYAEEIEGLIGHNHIPKKTIIATDATIEDPSVFALEKHLEDFLVQNWNKTLLGKKYNIYEVDGELVGQQFPSDTGNIDILAISKDGREILVIELKKGRVSDVVVGQVQRYMGYIKDELLENGQSVRGAIIALEDDIRIKRALSVVNNIDFYKYEVSFKLHK
jgi:restriction system protein